MLSTEFLTSSQPVKHRAEFWAAATTRFFGCLEMDVDAGEDFNARLINYRMGELDVFRIVAPGHRVRRTRVAEETASTESYKLVLQVKGSGAIEQAGKITVLHPGEWSIYDPRLAYTITNQEPMEELVVLIPRHPLRNFKLREVQCPLTGRPDLDSMQALFSNFLHSLSEQLPFLPDASANTFADTMMGLLISTLATRQAEKGGQLSNRGVMRARVKQFVNNHLLNPDLSIERIAQELNCSKRYLHRIFEDESVTLDRYIWNNRLERCREALEVRQAGAGSISQIAFACGFNSNAHFCRMFKFRFGVTPSDYQASAGHA